ncbi:hypothetical protein CP985_14800, partial [Malaciobacter mytili LMG 24559]
AVDDVYKEGSEKFKIAIDSATGTTNYEKVSLDKTAVETTITDESTTNQDNVNVKLVNSDCSELAEIEYAEEIKDAKHSSITRFSDGSYIVSWSGIDSNADASIFLQKYTLNGKTDGEKVKLEAFDNDNGEDIAPSISILKDGSYIVSWSGIDSDGDYSVYMQKFNRDDSKNGIITKLETAGTTTGHDWYPYIVTLASGAYILTWEGQNSNKEQVINIQKYNANGSKNGEITTVSDIGNTTNNDNFSILTLSDDSYIYSWEGRDSKGNSSIFIQRYNADGTKNGDIIQLDGTSDKSQVDGMLYTNRFGSGFIVTWSGQDSDGDRSIFVQKFKKDGTKDGTLEKYEASGVTDDSDIRSKITVLTDRSYVLSWAGEDSDGDLSIYVQKFNSDGTKSGDTIKLEALNNTTGQDYRTSVSRLEDGGYIVSWPGRDENDKLGVYIQRFDSDGNKDGEIIRLRGNMQEDWRPSVYILKDGSYIVKWEGTNMNTNNDSSVYIQKFNSDGTKATVYKGATLAEGENTTYKVTLIDDDGNVVKAIEDMVVTLKYTYISASAEDIVEVKTVTVKKGQSEVSFNIKAVDDVYKEGSEKFLIEIQSITNMDQFEKLTIDDKPVEITIKDETIPDNVNIKLNSNNIESGSYNIVEVGSGKNSKIVSLHDSYAVVWESKDSDGDSSIFVQKFNSSGEKDGQLVKLEAIGMTTGTDRNAQLVSQADNSFIVVWEGSDSSGDFSIFVQRFNADGTKNADIVKLEASNVAYGTDETPQITSLVDGSYVVTWKGVDIQGDSSIFIQKFNSDGTKNGNMLNLEEGSISSWHEKSPQITDLTDGSYVVTWHSGNDRDLSIYVQKFNSDGTKNGNLLKLDGVTSSLTHDMEPQIIGLVDGSYVVTWSGIDQGGDLSVFVQKISSDGTKADIVKLEAPNKTDGFDKNQQIISLKNGGYVVTWEGQDSDGDFSIFVQRFNSDGSKAGTIVILESLNATNFSEHSAQITSLYNNEYIVTWSGKSEQSETVFVQRFNSDGTKNGNILEFNGDLNFKVSNPQIIDLEDGTYVVTWTGENSSGESKVYTQKLNDNGSKDYIKVIVEEGENTTYTVKLTDDDGNVVKAIEDMEVSFKYTYVSASKDDIVEVKTVTVKKGESEVSFNVKAIENGNKEEAEIYKIEIDSATSTSQFENITLDKTAITTTINADEISGNLNVKLLADNSSISTYNVEAVGNSYGHHQSMAFADGSYITTWTVPGYHGILGQKYNSDGTKSGALIHMTKNLYTTTSMDLIPLKDSGKFIMTFHAATTVSPGTRTTSFIQRYNEDGSRDGEYIKLPSNGAVTYRELSDGGVITTLRTGSKVLLAQRYNKDGSKDGEEITLHKTNASPGIIETFDDGSYVITWGGKDSQGDHSVFVQKFNAKGVKLTDPIVLEGRYDKANHQIDPVVDQIGQLEYNKRVDGNQHLTKYGENGEFIITYKGYNTSGKRAVFFQRFNADGTKKGDQVEVQDDVINGTKPKIIELADGSFVVTYTLKLPENSSVSIIVQKYNEDGVKVGEPIIVDNKNLYDANPEILSLSDGSFVMSWATGGKTVNGLLRNTYMQKFNSDGTKDGDIVEVNKNSNMAGSPEFTSFKDGSYLITWYEHIGNAIFKVLNQKFNADGTKTLTQSTVGEGENTTYKVKLTDDDGNALVAKKDMVVTLKYTYMSATGDDIEEVKTVTVKKGESEVSFDVKAVNDSDMGLEKYKISIESITNTDKYETVNLEKAGIETIITDSSTSNVRSIGNIYLENEIDISSFTKVENPGIIDLEDGKANHITLKLEDILDISENNILKIFGDEIGDKVTLEGGSQNWTKEGTQIIDGDTFNIYKGLTSTTSNIKVFIDENISVDSDI